MLSSLLNKNVKVWKPMGWKLNKCVNTRRLYSEELIKNLKKSTANNLNNVERTFKYIFGTPFIIPFGIQAIEKNYVVIPLRFGKPDGYFTEGWTCNFPTFKQIVCFCGDKTINNHIQLIDSNGISITLSTYLTYNVIDPVNHYVNLKENYDNKNHGVLNNWVSSMIRPCLIHRNYITHCPVSGFSHYQLTTDSFKEKIKNDINSHENAALYGIKIKEFDILEIKLESNKLEDAYSPSDQITDKIECLTAATAILYIINSYIIYYLYT